MGNSCHLHFVSGHLPSSSLFHGSDFPFSCPFPFYLPISVIPASLHFLACITILHAKFFLLDGCIYGLGMLFPFLTLHFNTLTVPAG